MNWKILVGITIFLIIVIVGGVFLFREGKISLPEPKPKLADINNVVDLAAVSKLVTDHLASIVEGGGAGLIDRINANNPYSVSGLLFNAMETALNNNSLTTFETTVLESIGNIKAFRAVAGGANISSEQLDTVIAGLQPPPLF